MKWGIINYLLLNILVRYIFVFGVKRNSKDIRFVFYYLIWFRVILFDKISDYIIECIYVVFYILGILR